MGKNRKFKNTYLVTVEGLTTNGFVAELLDKMLRAVVSVIGSQHAQTNSSIKVIESEGDFDAETQKLRES